MDTAIRQLETVAADVLQRIRAHRSAAWSDAEFDELALDLFRAQRAEVGPYGAWCEHELGGRIDAGGSGEVSSWQEIPALPVAAFKQLSVGRAGCTSAAIWQSSGTTAAERSTHRLELADHYDAALDGGVLAALLPDVAAATGTKLACVQLQPTSDAAPTSSLSHMFDRIRTGPWCTDSGTWVDDAYRVDAHGAWQQLKQLATRRQPVLLLTTSFALAILLDNAESSGHRPLALASGSRIVDTGGFKGRTREVRREELLERVESMLGVAPAWCENEYGMSELSSQAWLGTVAARCGAPARDRGSERCGHGVGATRWMPPWLRVRVVDPVTLAEVADGAPGLLVLPRPRQRLELRCDPQRGSRRRSR